MHLLTSGFVYLQRVFLLLECHHSLAVGQLVKEMLEGNQIIVFVKQMIIFYYLFSCLMFFLFIIY